MKIEKHKRRYTPPSIEEYLIDHNISLVMMTTAWQPGDGKPPGPPGKDKKASTIESTPNTVVDNPYDTNPFK